MTIWCSNLCFNFFWHTWFLPDEEFQLNGILQCVLFRVCILSLSIMILGFIILCINGCVCFVLLLSHNSLHQDSMICLSVFLLMDISQTGHLQFGAIMKKEEYSSLCKSLSGKYLAVVLLGCWVVLQRECLCPPTTNSKNPNPHCDGIWRWGLWGVIRLGD